MGGSVANMRIKLLTGAIALAVLIATSTDASLVEDQEDTVVPEDVSNSFDIPEDIYEKNDPVVPDSTLDVESATPTVAEDMQHNGTYATLTEETPESTLDAESTSVSKERRYSKMCHEVTGSLQECCSTTDPNGIKCMPSKGRKGQGNVNYYGAEGQHNSWFWPTFPDGSTCTQNKGWYAYVMYSRTPDWATDYCSRYGYEQFATNSPTPPPTRNPTKQPTRSPTHKRYMSGCQSIQSAEECCKYHDGLTGYQWKYSSKGLSVEGDPCIPGQWDSGRQCEPKSWVDTQENSGNMRSCSWTGWTPPSKAPTSPPTFPQCDLHDADFLMENKETYMQYIGPESEMMKCKAEVDITLPFVTDVDKVMDEIGKREESVKKLKKVVKNLKKIHDKVHPLIAAIPKVGSVSKIVKKILTIAKTVSSVLKAVVTGCKHIHGKVSNPAKTALGVVQTGIATFETKATTYFEGMTHAYNCKNQRCGFKDKLNKAARLGTTIFEDYGMEDHFRTCEDKLSAVNGAPKALWDKVMSLFHVVIPGIDAISDLVDQIMGFIDKLANDALGLMNAAKCCMPDHMQIGANMLVSLFNLLMCPLHGVEINLMKKVKEILSEKMLEFVELLVPDVNFDLDFKLDSGIDAPIPGLCGKHELSAGLEFEFKLKFDLKAQMRAQFESAIGKQTNTASGSDIADIGEAIKKSCAEAFATVLKPNLDTCDCALMGALGDMVDGVGEMSEDALNVAKGAGKDVYDSAKKFNNYAGKHIGAAWNTVKDFDAGDTWSNAGNTVKSVFGEE